MPTPNKRSVLRVLTRATLLDIGRRHGLDVRVSDDHRSLVNAIAGSRKAGLEDIVRGLSRDELKKVCRQHDLDDSGRSKRPIADRILGLEEAPALPGIVGERAGGPTQQPTVDSVIAELPLETLKQIARSYRITLPRGRASKQTVISRIRDHIPSLVAVLGQLTREDLSGVALAHGLSDDRRSIDELVARLLAAASGGSPATVDDAAKAGASAAVDDAAKVGSPAPQRTASPRARPEAQRSPAAPTFELARAATQERLARDVPPRPPERTLREPGAPPRAGDLAIVRHRRYWVEAVAPATSTREQTCVELVCLDDDAAGRKLTVLWELELGARVLDPAADGLGVVDRLDPPRHFAAYFNAVRWNCVTATDPGIFQAPFRAGIRIEEHQLAPLQRALALPRANLFIADDVGLGKTIEAGLVLQELLLRQRVDFVLVVAPAAITLQWRGEMARRFGLNFEIVDRAFVSSRRRARGMDVNPWSTHNRFIVSYQTLRRPEYREPLLRFLGPDRKRKSLLVLDEAHTVAPSSNVRTFGDSQLTKDARSLAPRFENRLFLSATPHNGHSGSFSALLEILDRQRFTRGVPVSGPAALRPVMVRRLKQDLKAVGRGSFPDRVPVELSLEHNRGAWTSRSSLDSEPVAIGAASDAEVALSHLLARYTELAEPEKGDGKFAFITLQKRLLSSIEAFRKTLRHHARRVLGEDPFAEADDDDDEYEALEEEDPEVFGSDDDGEVDEQVERASYSLTRPGDDAIDVLRRMISLARDHADEPSAKVLALLQWVRANLCPAAGDRDCPETAWSNRRVIIFTEYSDTKRYLVERLREAIAHTDLGDRRILQFHGGMSDAQREELQEAFNEAAGAHPVRILVATDAAREGINLQGNCADLFHYDIPWNPARMEQRNGRIDRVLQPAAEVRCHYFTLTGRAEDRVLRTVVDKVGRIARELGSLSGVVLEQVEETLAGGIRGHTAAAVEAISEAPAARRTAEAEADAARLTQDELRRQIDEFQRILHKSRRYLGFDDNQLREAVDVALTLVAGEGLTPLADGGYFALPELPPSWVTTTDHLRKPRTRDTPLWQWRQEPLPAVSFTPEQAVGSERVHLHLAHPVVHRLLSRFLAQGHAAHDLSRATVLGAPAGDRTRVLAFGRLSLFGAGATRLHDRIIAVAAYWNLAGGDDHLRPFAPGSGDEREAQLHLDAALLTAKAVSEVMYRPMLERAAADFRALWSAIEEEAAAEEQRARLQLADRGRVEAGELRTILEQHRAELNRELAGQTQELFPDEPLSKKQRQQREAYRQYMDERRRSIEADLQTEPAELARSYDVVTRRLEPLGVVYLVRSAS